MSVKILVGDVRKMLSTLADGSVNCVVTSPPYFGLRDYGTASWTGGDPSCAHEGSDRYYTEKTAGAASSGAFSEAGEANAERLRKGRWREGGECVKCGARHADLQIGLEPSPAAFVAVMVDVFREVRRVLRKDGTCWLNMGDSYNAYNGGAGPGSKLSKNQTEQRPQLASGFGLKVKGLKPKDRMMIPARLAIALQDDGWWLRDEIVWHKPNPMPSSVKDRTTPAHEMLYLLTKSARYHYDAEAIMEPMSDVSIARLSQPSIGEQKGGDKQDQYEANGLNDRTGSRRPNQIVQGLAAKIGKNERIDGPAASTRTRAGFNARWDASEAHGRLNNQDEKLVAGEKWGARHEGWKATAADRVGRNKRSVWMIATEPFPEAHFATFPTALIEPCILAGCPKGGIVLDPFGGAGTTSLVADRLGRNSILIELNPAYAEIARARIKADAGMFSDVA